MKTQEELPYYKNMVEKKEKKTLFICCLTMLYAIYVTEVAESSCLSFPPFFHGTIVFLCF